MPEWYDHWLQRILVDTRIRLLLAVLIVALVILWSYLHLVRAISSPPVATKSSLSSNPSYSVEHRFASTCNDLGTTTAQLTDVTDLATSSLLHWIATSTDALGVGKDAGLWIDKDKDPATGNYASSRLFLPVTGMDWSVIATFTPDHVPRLDLYDITNHGWQDSLLVRNLKVSPSQWEGTSGLNQGISGFIRRRGNCIQFSQVTNVPMDYVEQSIGPGLVPEIDPVSPYRYRSEIFVSDWIPISTIMASATAQSQAENTQ